MRRNTIHFHNPVFLFAALLSLAAFSGMLAEPVLAQGRPGGGMPPGARGRMRPPKPPKPIPLNDVHKLVEKQHEQADQDGNGYLTVAEVRSQIDAMAETIVRERFGKIDTDGDAAVSYAEFSAWQRSMGSQALDDVAAASLNQQMVPKSLPFDVGDGRNAQIMRRLVQPLNVTMLSQADSNYDGNISVEELKAVQSKRFNTVDENSDGFLTFDEMRKMRDQMPGRVRRQGPPPEGAPPPSSDN